MLRWKFQNGFSDEKVIARILLDTLQGLKALHSSGMIHRDIKCGNRMTCLRYLIDLFAVLYDKDATIKLADFGVSTILARHDERRTTMVGTWHWMAPEVIDPAVGYSQYLSLILSSKVEAMVSQPTSGRSELLLLSWRMEFHRISTKVRTKYVDVARVRPNGYLGGVIDPERRIKPFLEGP